MFHFLYLLVFTALALFAVTNMIRNMVRMGTQMSQPPTSAKVNRTTPHPELLNEEGSVISEPLLVMRSISIQDAREQLNAMYEASGSNQDDSQTEES